MKSKVYSGSRLGGVSRRRLARSPWVLLAGLNLSGCVFFRSDYDKCFADQDCSRLTSTPGDGDGDNSVSSGGSFELGGADGSGGVDASGGFTASGGDASRSGGAGGTDQPGSGGASSGGRGGETESGGQGSGGAAASGGDSGSGGNGSGGDGSGGNPGVDRLSINELRTGTAGFVEIYNASSQTVDLTDLYLSHGASEPIWTDTCSLASAGTLAPGGYVELTTASTCRGVLGCITDCSWSVAAGETVYLLDNNTELLEIVAERGIPSGLSLTVGKSYAAYPDGSNAFATRGSTPSAPNTPD